MNGLQGGSQRLSLAACHRFQNALILEQVTGNFPSDQEVREAVVREASSRRALGKGLGAAPAPPHSRSFGGGRGGSRGRGVLQEGLASGGHVPFEFAFLQH